jgi:hypothetical protein
MTARFKVALCASVLFCSTQAEAARYLVVDIAASGVGRGSIGSRTGPGMRSYDFTTYYASFSYYLDGFNPPFSTANTLTVFGQQLYTYVSGTFSSSGYNFSTVSPLNGFVAYNLTGKACYSNPTPTAITTGSPAFDPACSTFSASYSDGFAVTAYNFTGNLTGINFRVVEADTLPGITFSIPEPATWALMLAGFAMTGYALRRRRASVAFA